jgi:hypothetical protein
MKDSEENYVYLLAKIDGFIRKHYLNKVLKGICFLLASSLMAYILVIAAEHLGRFESQTRAILFYSFISLNLFVFIRYIVIPLLSYFKLGQGITREQASRIIGEHFTPVKDKLLNAIQLKSLCETNPEQSQLIEASLNQKIAELRSISFVSAIRLSKNIDYLKIALPPLAILIFILFTAPSILSESSVRLINYNKHFVEKAPFEFTILNESLVAEEGSDFTLLVKVRGDQVPDQLYLEDGTNTQKLNKENNVRFNYVFKNIQKGREIVLSTGKYRSNKYSIRVKGKASIISFDVLIDYPKYLKKNREILKNTGDLMVPEGSKISWLFNAVNSDLVDIQIDDKKYSLKKVDGDQFNFGYTAFKSTSYRVSPVRSEFKVSTGVNYQIKVIPDLEPEIEVQEIRDSINRNIIYFTGQLSDDHGLSKLTLNYRVLGADQTKTIYKAIHFEKNLNRGSFIYAWDINSIGAKLDENVEYYFEVFDNDGLRGPKSGKSLLKTLKIPSQKERDQEKREKSKEIKEKMEEAIKKAKELERESKKINQELLNKNSLTFEDKKQLEKLLKKQFELENVVKEIQNQNRENGLSEKNNDNEQLLEKQKEIEKLFNNVLDEKTKEILRNIEKLIEKNNKEQSRNELSKVQMDNKSLQKELDRILELYKQLEFDQLLSDAIEKLKRIAEEQKALANKSIEKNADLAKLRGEQKALQEEFNNLKSDMAELNNKNDGLEQKNNFNEPIKDLEKINEELKTSLEKLEKRELKEASNRQKEASNKMQELSNKLKKMQEEEEESENEINKAGLRQLLENLVKTSFEQEKIMKDLRGMSTINPNYISTTQKQKNIQSNFKLIEDSLYALSKRIPQIESAANKEVELINLNIKKAIENLAERKTAEANREQQYAMTSVNNLALMLSEVLDQLDKLEQNGKTGGKGKKKQSLSQLSKMQEQLNKNMQKAREEMQNRGEQSPGKLGNKDRNMSENFAKMAREQQMIRQSIQEINKLENKDGKGGLGNLEKLIKEMEQTETDLVNKRIKEETLIRQEDILSKLLIAEKSEKEREQEEKREGITGNNQLQIDSKILIEYLKNKEKETDLIRTISPTLNSFYKIKVGNYFKFLNSGNK